MKPIELSEDQKTKLLEMCQVLFPEYKFGFENDNSDLGIMEFYPPNSKWKEVTFTHWFEFCLTHLVDKISNRFEIINKENRQIIRDDLYHSIWKLNHNPIDYLYSQFKMREIE